jgi:hypothetical protein
MTATFWTTNRVKALVAQWTAGATATEIASSFGCTRDAALGKLNRLGLLGTGRTPSESDRIKKANAVREEQRQRYHRKKAA